MRRRKRELTFQLEWGDLATYNTERSRGIVHTPEMDARMAEKQTRYNQRRRDTAPPGTIFVKSPYSGESR